MPEFNVAITETLFKVVTIKAETAEDAYRKVRKKWNNSEYILDADDFLHVEFGVINTEKDDDDEPNG